MPPKKNYEFNEPLDCLRFLTDNIAVIANTSQCAGLLALLPASRAPVRKQAMILEGVFYDIARKAEAARRNVKNPMARRISASHVMAAAALLGIVERPGQHTDSKLKTTKTIRQKYAGEWLYPERINERHVRDDEDIYLAAMLDALSETLDGRPPFEYVNWEALTKVVQQQGLHSPDDLRFDRSLFHVIRTLETRREHASSFYDCANRIDDALARYRDWNQHGTHDAGAVLHRFDFLCREFFDKSVYELIGNVKIKGEGPEYSPHELLPFCKYSIGASMVLVEGGNDAFTGELVKPFFMSVYPVTTYEWHFFLQRFGWKERSDTWNKLLSNTSWLSFTPIMRWPAVGMAFYDCVTYCFWLWHRTPYHFRLPAEAEWNFAATGGEHLRFPWGNDERSNAGRYLTPGEPYPVAVDDLPPAGPYALSGLSGNVWEYTSTLWRGDDPVSDSDIVIPDLAQALAGHRWWRADNRTPRIMDEYSWKKDVKLVMKGGSYELGSEWGEVSTRIYTSFFNAGRHGGFRLAVSAIKDSATGMYVPKPSPFVNSESSQVQLLSSQDLVGKPTPGMTFAGCEVAVTANPLGPPKGDSSWAELLRARYE
jgi:formylglycine-generating enzyme required for sulfatase activity